MHKRAQTKPGWAGLNQGVFPIQSRSCSLSFPDNSIPFGSSNNPPTSPAKIAVETPAAQGWGSPVSPDYRDA